MIPETLTPTGLLATIPMPLKMDFTKRALSTAMDPPARFCYNNIVLMLSTQQDSICMGVNDMKVPL